MQDITKIPPAVPCDYRDNDDYPIISTILFLLGVFNILAVFAIIAVLTIIIIKF